MPDMIPVGNTIIPQNPMTGINTLSGIIGIQQQRQNLQTGQYIQQSAAAKAQQEGLAAQQAQGVQNFFKTWDPTQHVGNDGTTDLDSALQSDEFKASGNAKPAVMQALLDIKNKQLTNKTALAGLNNALVTQFGQQSGALAKDPDVIADTPDPKTGVNAGRAKIKEMLTNFSAQSPDAARIAAIYSPLVDHVSNKKGALASAIGALQMQARDVGGQQEQQNPALTAVARGGTTDIYNVNKATGIQPGQQPATSIPMSMPPGTKQTLETDPQTHTAVWVTRDANGNVVGSSPASKGPIPAPGGGGGGPSQPSLPSRRPPAPTAAAPSAATGFGAPGTGIQIEAVNQRAQQAIAAANASPQALDALTRAKAIMEQPGGAPNTGGMFETLRGVKNYLSSVGEDTKGANDANSLLKNLARYEASRATAVGLGGTDAARALAHNGSPNVSLDNKALLGIINQSIGTEQAMNAFANKQQTTQDPAKLQANEAAFRKIPNVIEGYEYRLARSPQEADSMLARHGLSHADITSTLQQMRQFEKQ